MTLQVQTTRKKSPKNKGFFGFYAGKAGRIRRPALCGASENRRLVFWSVCSFPLANSGKMWHNREAEAVPPGAANWNTQRYRSGHNGPDSKSCYLCLKLNNYTMETYRSGHNEPDSKSGSPQGLVGSNPTVSAINPAKHEVLPGLSYFLNIYNNSFLQ